MKKKVALIHDWLLHYRGGEKVLEALCELYPDADIYTLFYKPGRVCPTIERHRIIASFLNGWPGAHKFYRYLLPLFPLAVERWNLKDYDVVISSSHCVAKGVIPAPHAFHLSYVYTPMRYAWDKYGEYFGGKFWEPLAYLVLHYLRMWDVSASARVESSCQPKRILKSAANPPSRPLPFCASSRKSKLPVAVRTARKLSSKVTLPTKV